MTDLRLSESTSAPTIGHGSTTIRGELADPRGVTALGGGTTALADAGVPAIYIIDRADTAPATIGRAGSGPGEFREPALVAFWGESLAVFDAPQHRLSYFRRDGSLIRQRTISIPGTIVPAILSIRADGALIYKGTVMDGQVDGSDRISAHALVLAMDADDGIDTIASIPDGPWLPNGPLWFAWRSAVVVTDSGIWYGSGNAPEVTFQPWQGPTRAPLRWTAKTRAVNAHDREAIAALAGSRHAAPALTAPDRFADSVPHFGRLLPDSHGGVWVIGYTAPFASPDSAWWVNDSAGTISGVALSPGFRPAQFGSDFVLGIQADEDGGLTLARLRMKR